MFAPCRIGLALVADTIPCLPFQSRQKHSARQVKRIFQKNPGRRRIARRKGEDLSPTEPLHERQFQAIMQPTFLPNGWSAPPASDIEVPSYPFQITRTRNKPNDAVGFLPVYSEFRKDGSRVTTRIKKVSGDRDLFLNELRAVLELPKPLNPKEENIRIRTGGTIEVKGNRVREVRSWLASLGF